MRKERKKRTKIIIVLCSVLFLMSVGYAAFQTNLDIKGTSNITNNWDIEIINVTAGAATGTAENVNTPTWNSLTAYMEANLYEKGDAMTYEITIQNKGSLDAKLDSITKNIKTNNEAIKISFEGYTKGERLYSKGNDGDTKTIIAKIEYNEDFTGEVDQEQSSEVSITLNYVQAEGKEGTDVPEPDTYLVNYDCTTNGGKTCTEYNEYLKEGETVNLLYKGNNSKYEFIGWNTDPKAREGLISLQMGSENITLYAIYETDPIIQSWSSTDTSDFHSEAYKQSIISAEFLNTREIPENATESWDVSAAKDKSVMAWVVADETDSTKHHLYIGGKGGVIANEDSSYLFYKFTNVESIDFHNNFDTSKVTDMSYMFDNSSTHGAIKEIKGLENFDTSKVTNMSGMFRNGSYTSLNLTTFNTKNVYSFNCMFSMCTNLTYLNISTWNTDNLTNTAWMFEGTALTILKICNFNTLKVDSMNGMFYRTKNLTKVYVGPNWSTTNATVTNMWNGSKISSVTQSNNCFIDAEDPATLSFTTTKTTNSITVITEAKAESGISKYEYSKDNGSTWEESTEPIHTFTGLTQETTYNIKVRVTSKVGKQTTSNTISVITNTLSTPTYSETETDDGNTIAITYPDGCTDYTCEYSKDAGATWETYTEPIIFTESGTLVARVTDKGNTSNIAIASSYTVVFIPLFEGTPSQLKSLAVTTDDGLYADSTESGRYVYKGLSPNNYICLTNEKPCLEDNLYRIISIENDGTLKVRKNTEIGKMLFDPGYLTNLDGITSANSIVGTRYSSNSTDYCYVSSASSYYGCNVWGSSSTMLDSSGNHITKMPKHYASTTTYNLPSAEAYINTYLNKSWYEELKNRIVDIDEKIDNHLWNVGLLNWDSTHTLVQNIGQEKAYKWKGKIGIMNPTDYVKASTNSACTTVRVGTNYTERPCSVNNWLNQLNQWAINPDYYNGIIYIWNVANGYLNNDYGSSSGQKVFPAFYLKSDIRLTGKGTRSTPFTLSGD